MANVVHKLICRRNSFYLFRHSVSEKLVPMRNVSMTGHSNFDKGLDTLTGGKIEGWLKTYEDMVGLTEVRDAQTKVIEAERKFVDVQAERRKRQTSISEVHSKLKDLHVQLDKVQRGDKRYLDLLTEEYEIIKEEKNHESQLNEYETLERHNFAALSSAVRESHEKERARTERTKYWSIMGSVVGVTLGIIGTTINNYLRMRELKGIVTDSAAGGVELKGLVAQLSDTMKKQHNQVQGFIGDLKTLTGSTPRPTPGDKPAPSLQSVIATGESNIAQLEEQTREILGVVRKQEEAITLEMGDIKKILASSRASDSDGNIVYVGPEMESLIKKAENSLEGKIKLNALWTITFIYGAFALSLPVLYSIFKGN